MRVWICGKNLIQRTVNLCSNTRSATQELALTADILCSLYFSCTHPRQNNCHLLYSINGICMNSFYTVLNICLCLICNLTNLVSILYKNITAVDG